MPDGERIVFTTTAAVTLESFVEQVSGEFAQRGYSVHLVCGDRVPRVDHQHVAKVLPMERGTSIGSDSRALRAWVTYLRKVRPEMIIAGTPKASLLSMTAGRILRIPARVYVLHGAVWDGAESGKRLLLESTERITLASSTRQIAVSDSLARLVYSRRLTRTMPTVLGSGSFCGVDTTRFQPESDQIDNDPTMIFVGRLNRDKGIDVLLRTLDRVRTRVDARLVVVGGLDETAPPTEETMNTLVQHPFVDWVGEVADVEPLMKSADLLLLPTKREGLPQVALEAQACGLPVVSWRATGVIDAVVDGFTGILVGHGDEDALAAASIDILTHPDTRARMSQNSRRWIMDRFRQDLVVPRVADALEDELYWVRARMASRGVAAD